MRRDDPERRGQEINAPLDIAEMKELVSNAQLDKALTILTTTPDDILVQYGLRKLASFFREAGFIQGELHLASIMQRNHGGFSIVCLDATEIFLRAGLAAKAGSALNEALKFHDAKAQIKKMLGLSTQLKDSQLCEAVFELLVSDTELSVKEKVVDGVQFAVSCNGFDGRQISLRSLKKLEKISECDIDCLDRVAQGFAEIREFSMCLEIREKTLATEPDSLTRRFDVLEMQCKLNREKARENLNNLLAKSFDSVMFWERVSIVWYLLGEVANAVDATMRALRLGANEISNRRRLAILQHQLKNYGAVTAEIKRLMEFPTAERHVLRNLCHLAADAGDISLALSCAKREYEEQRDRPDVALNFVQVLIRANLHEEATRVIIAFCEQPLKNNQTSVNDFLSMANEAARIGREDIALDTIKTARKYYPESSELEKGRRAIESQQRLLGTKSSPKDTTEVKKKTFFTDFFKKFFVNGR